MPRRIKNARRRGQRPKRGAYRPVSPAIAAIEAKRARLAVTQAELASRTGIAERTIRRMVKDGRGFARHVRALQFALRTIERERGTESGAL